MSRELQRKAIEAGIIPAGAVRLFKMWRSMPEDMPEDIRVARTQEELLGVIGELEELLEQDQEIPEMRETELELDAIWEQSARTVQIVYRMDVQNLSVRHPAARTRQGGFFFRYLHPSMEMVVRPGTQITTQENEVFEVTQVSPRYVEEQVRYLVCDVQEVPNHAVVRAVPEIGSGEGSETSR